MKEQLVRHMNVYTNFKGHNRTPAYSLKFQILNAYSKAYFISCISETKLMFNLQCAPFREVLARRSDIKKLF
jgi:hypothetical protein